MPLQIKANSNRADPLKVIVFSLGGDDRPGIMPESAQRIQQSRVLTALVSVMTIVPLIGIRHKWIITKKRSVKKIKRESCVHEKD
jgi:hypothetical protein